MYGVLRREDSSRCFSSPAVRITTVPYGTVPYKRPPTRIAAETSSRRPDWLYWPCTADSPSCHSTLSPRRPSIRASRNNHYRNRIKIRLAYHPLNCLIILAAALHTTTTTTTTIPSQLQAPNRHARVRKKNPGRMHRRSCRRYSKPA